MYSKDRRLALEPADIETQLTIQTSAHILIMHYSRVMPPVDGQRYFSSTAVFLNEVVKLTVSLTMALYGIATNPKTPDTSTAAGLFGELGREVFTGDSWKVAIPAMMYTLQNTLQYVAISNLDVATFQVTNQLKILISAVLSVIFLGRRLGGRKWLALVLLLVGVAVVQIPSGSSHSAVLSIKDLRGGMAFHEARSIWDLKMAGNKAAGQLSKRSATYEGIDEDFQAANPEINATHGLIAIVLASILSGLNSLYFEKGLNEPRNENATSAWVRQVQMSFYSMWPALFLGVLFKDGEHIAKTGFFAGYNWAVWTAIILQAVGGTLVGFVINISSNSVKNVAASIAIPTSFVGSVLFDFKISSFVSSGVRRA